MIRQSAIVDLYPGQQIVGTLMRAQPHSSSAVHHHGNQDTIVYAVSGKGAIVSDGGKVSTNRNRRLPTAGKPATLGG